MGNDADQFENLAAQQASSTAVRSLFEQLATRAERLSALHDELQRVIVTNREERSGKPFHFSPRQGQLLSEFQKDAQDGRTELPSRIARLSDASLLSIALRSERQQLETEAKLYAVFREEDKAPTRKILSFRQETIRIITDFIEHSEFRDAVPTK